MDAEMDAIYQAASAWWKEDELVRKLDIVENQYRRNKQAKGTRRVSISGFYKPTGGSNKW